MNIPAIILAGGLGTRLRQVVKELPKPMAPIGGKPFLHYLFKYLKAQGIEKTILSVGYKAESIKEYFGDNYDGISILYMEEEKPLGTGGGIYQAISLADGMAFVLNGDSFFDVNLKELIDFYRETKADIAMSLKPMKNFDRYGTVTLNGENRIIGFAEKQFQQEGLINAGVYLMSRDCFQKIEEQQNALLPRKFSFEQDILEKHLHFLRLEGKVSDGYFIDIGIPEDYQRAQSEFALFFKQ